MVDMLLNLFNLSSSIFFSITESCISDILAESAYSDICREEKSKKKLTFSNESNQSHTQNSLTSAAAVRASAASRALA